MLSSCLLRHKTPNCLRSPGAQHTLGLRAQQATSSAFATKRLLSAPLQICTKVFPVTSQISAIQLPNIWNPRWNNKMLCNTYSFSTRVRDRKRFGFILHLSAQYLRPENNSPCKSNYFGSLPLLPHFSIFKKVYAHVPQWFLLAWVICNYDYLLSPSFHPDVALEHQRTQTVWQVSPQTGKLNGSAANQGAPFPMGQWLKSSSGNKWSENPLWPERATYTSTGIFLVKFL